jgi:hypothetical protein
LASCASEAERIVTEEVQRRGWQEQDLVSRRKNDPARLEIAARLRRQTALSLREIAALVHGNLQDGEQQPARAYAWRDRERSIASALGHLNR